VEKDIFLMDQFRAGITQPSRSDLCSSPIVQDRFNFNIRGHAQKLKG
jgi:hypothetical protein